MKKNLSLILMGILLLQVSVFAQTDSLPDTLQVTRDSRSGLPTFIRFSTESNNARKFQQEVQLLEHILQLTPGVDELHLVKEKEDDLGYVHKRYQQYYHGVKVDNYQYLTHWNRNSTSMSTMNGRFAKIGNIPYTPVISEQQALKSALQTVNSKKYAWEDPALETVFKQNAHDSVATLYPKGELVIADVSNDNEDRFVIAWKFIIKSLQPYTDEYVYINAINGSLVKKINRLCNINTPGTVTSLYSGSQAITGDSFNGQFRLFEMRNNAVPIHTLDLNGGSSIGTATEFLDNDNNWTAGEHGGDLPAHDAHWAAEAVYDYYKNVRGRNSLDNANGAISGYVHWGSGIVNAQWDPSLHVMFYGDGGIGPGFQFYDPLVSLDIAAHEMTHGVIQYEGDLEYKGESGALNEGIADIFGEVVQFWKSPTKPRWQIGEEIAPLPLRRMDNPPANTIPPLQPDCVGGVNYVNPNCGTPDPGNDYCGVHRNSGIINYWFYLVSEGGSGTNDLGNSFNVSSIGITNAASIVYRMVTQYLQPNATFANARDVSIQSARELFGTNSCAEITVTNAWHAVGVGAAFNTNNLSISGNTNACISSTYTGLGPAVTWSISPATGVATLTTSGNTATLTKIANGGLTLTANFSGCGITPVSKIKTVYMGLTSQVANVTGPSPVYTGSLYNQFRLNTTVPVSSYSWTVPSDWSIFSGGTTFRPTILTGNGSNGSSRVVKCTISGCGATETYSFTTYFGTGGPDPLRTSRPDSSLVDRVDTAKPIVANSTPLAQSIKVYPNPNAGIFIVEPDGKVGVIKSLVIYNSAGVVIFRTDLGDGTNKVTVDLSTSPNGTYFMELNGNKAATRRVIIQH